MPFPKRWSELPPRGPRRFRALFVVVLCAVLVGLAACGGAARSASAGANGAPSVVAQRAADGALPAAPPVAVAQSRASAAAAATQAGAPGQATSLPSTPPGAMLIRTAAIEIEAASPLDVVASVRQVATAASSGADFGYVADEQTRTNGDQVTATVTIEVPSPTFAAVMDQLRRLGSKVVSETSNSQDVTEQYVDVDAQLQALRATQAQLLQLLGKTQQLTDTLAVQRELTQIDMQINQLEGRENYLKSHSAFSTITVTIHPPATTVKPQPLWNPLGTLLGALGALGSFGQHFVDFLIYLLVFGLPLVIVGGLAWLIVRRVLASLGPLRRTPPPTPAP